MLRNEIGVLAQPIAGALDLNDDGMVKQPVEQRGCDDGIAEDLAPFGKAAIGGEDHGASFVSYVDELEEEVSAARHDREIADLVDNKQGGAAQIPDPLPPYCSFTDWRAHYDVRNRPWASLSRRPET